MSISPTMVDFDIPARSGEVLCVPPAAQFLAIAASNRKALDTAPGHLAGVRLGEIRRSARAAALAAASAYGTLLGIGSAVDAEDPRALIGTGHQPFLFHPGIWSKHLLAARFTERAVVVNMPVDSDAAEDVGVDAPHLDGGLSIVRETLLRGDPDVPYEVIPPPAEAEWQAFLRRIDGHLQTLPHRSVREVFAGFVDRTRGLRAPDIGSFLTLARRRHEGPTRYSELPVSQLAATREFRLFALHIITDAERFAAEYNAHLEAYRERQNIRTPAQPFPGLGREGPRLELPFWILHGGRRRPMFVERRGGGYRLWAGEEEVAGLDGRAPEELEALAIRPKALALTAFTRLCVVDLFIHGVGGGRYDRVTDAVLRSFFGVTPPRYAVVSATLHLPLSEFDPTEERAALQRRHLELLHNPERALTEPSDDQRRWIDEKWRLIGRLDDASLTRRERREATQRIREINEQLREALGAERTRLEHRLASLDEIRQASSAATHRGYPFCFFPPSTVEELVDPMTAGTDERR